MGLVLDAVFAAIVLCFVVAGYRAGLMRTLVEFVGYLFAVVASVVLAGLVADVLADLFLQARAPSPTEYYFLRVIATAIVFVLLQMLVRMIASAVSAVCRLPLLHTAVSLLGCLFGAFKGVVVVLLLCSFVQLAGPVFELDSGPLHEQELFTTSYIFRFISAHNPVYSLFHVEDFLEGVGGAF